MLDRPAIHKIPHAEIQTNTVVYFLMQIILSIIY